MRSIVKMVEKWRKTLDEVEEILTDISKAFDCIDHNLLTSKFSAYGFEKRSLEFIHFCLYDKFMGNIILRCATRVNLQTTFILYLYL